jgi:hypothetical protein
LTFFKPRRIYKRGPEGAPETYPEKLKFLQMNLFLTDNIPISAIRIEYEKLTIIIKKLQGRKTL